MGRIVTMNHRIPSAMNGRGLTSTTTPTMSATRVSTPPKTSASNVAAGYSTPGA